MLARALGQEVGPTEDEIDQALTDMGLDEDQRTMTKLLIKVNDGEITYDSVVRTGQLQRAGLSNR